LLALAIRLWLILVAVRLESAVFAPVPVGVIQLGLPVTIPPFSEKPVSTEPELQVSPPAPAVPPTEKPVETFAVPAADTLNLLELLACRSIMFPDGVPLFMLANMVAFPAVGLPVVVTLRALPVVALLRVKVPKVGVAAVWMSWGKLKVMFGLEGVTVIWFVVPTILNAPVMVFKLLTPPLPPQVVQVGAAPFVELRQKVPAPLAAVDWIAPLLLPYNTPLAVKLVAPVPPLPTARVLVTCPRFHWPLPLIRTVPPLL
jgi:hypothetical protein